jgi:hypothetical protein
MANLLKNVDINIRLVRPVALMRACLLVLVCLVLSTCSAPTPLPLGTTASTAPDPAQPHYKEIEVLSQPTGARIEVNEDYVCDAPCTLRVRCDSDGRFFETTTIRALPVGYGYTQAKSFLGFGAYAGSSGYYLDSARIPSRILFDMNLAPVSQDININVNQ